jgi:uncharacterized phage protein (TIGR02218 family)
MRTVSAGLLSLLNSMTSFLMADLYTVTLLDGTVLRYTSCDFALTYNNHSYAPQGKGSAPAIERSGWECATGGVVGQLELTLLCGDSAQLNGVAMVLQAHNGAFDGATVVLERAFMPTWGDTSLGTVPLFTGSVSEIDLNSTQITFRARDRLDLLSIQMPRNVFLPLCAHLLYDAGCTLNRVANSINCTVGTGATISRLQAALSTGQTAGVFESGILAFTSGPCAGARRGVRTFDGTWFQLSTPLPTIPAAGDAFTVSKGCDRTLATCTSRFNNKANWRGFKDIPPAEASI